MTRPITIAPALDISEQSAHQKQLAHSPLPSTPASAHPFTQREWIVPPRPKPGRKPSTDTPPTKRKAQNRAAQRAFRERRAARVNELEDKIKVIEEEDERTQDSMQLRIAALEKELDNCNSKVLHWHQRYESLESTLLSHGLSTDTVPLPRRSKGEKAAGEDLDPGSEEDLLMGCGNCTIGTRCDCVEQAFDLGPTKRPPSPTQDTASKRPRSSIIDHTSLETDFTKQFAAVRSLMPAKPSSPLDASERCGFCSDGTTCVCAELESQGQDYNLPSNRLAPLLSRFTPPLSETGSSSSSARLVPISRRTEARTSNSCDNGPGTCDQCRSDPNSTIFCKSLAAMKKPQPGSGPPGCCGDSGGAGGCCKGNDLAQSQILQTRPPGVALSCADVYTTLSRHPAYEQASDDLGSWLGCLKPALPQGEHGRPAMEIEAASVMGVLKLFDRRFGREAP
ncbi:MAG: hypothetical protein M1814_001667 [Vezdaea aestivalis]|nr:MAG: hypothetical protein M1814_001667 [Vezdaea aestivalis]